MTEYDEVRPFFGERSEPVGVVPPLIREPERHTLNERRELTIADGRCPLPGCFGTLDEDFNCFGCGNTSVPAQPVEEEQPVDLPVFPLALTLDEYAPASLDEDEAA